MHGHPFSGPMQLWWGKTAPAERPRNLFHTFSPGDKPPPGDMYRAGGHISLTGRIGDRESLHRHMAKLADRTRMVSEPGPNTAIPAGYTYLLQFIAHDIVDSVPSFGTHDQDVVPGAFNGRSRPLMLDTLYGSSPDEFPHAYEFSPRQEERGLIPRTHFRLGTRAAAPSASDPYCPFRDIVRFAHPERRHPGGTPMLTEAMLADPRNDTHALVSQLTVLFQLLHNHVLTLIENAVASVNASARLPPRELAYRQFQCARTVVTLIYRSIIEKDVLGRILHPSIHARYLTREPIDCGDGVPLEFTFGAFRFGHAMVRQSYSTNSVFRDQPTDGALEGSSLLAHFPGRLPIGRNWLIDWARFFDNEKGIVPNPSSLIAPRHPPVLATNTYLFPAMVPGADTEGLLHRDLLSAAFAGPMSVPALIRSLQAQAFAEVQTFAFWQAELRAWLPANGFYPPSDPDLDRVVDDPPLPFFILFEAAHGGGRHLGPVGSAIVAETFRGALKAHPGPADGVPLKEAIATCGESLLGVRDLPRHPAAPAITSAVVRALAEIDEITTMTGLLGYMERVQAFARP